MDSVVRNYLCHECVGDDYFKRIIKEEGKRQKCSFCNLFRKCIDLDEVSERVDIVFRENYKPSDEYPSFEADSDKVYWEYRGSFPNEIIADMLKVENNVADEIIKNLIKIFADAVIREGEENLYDETTQYEEVRPSTSEYSWIWSKFCHSVKHSSRFFNPEAEDLLKEIFRDIDQISTFTGQPIIRVIPNGDNDRHIFRGRQADDDSTRIRIIRMPWKELGPPPEIIATGGRMNPPGISVFYGAFERDTCISELRLPVGSIGITGQFEFIQSVRVLDLTIFDNAYISVSMFHPDYSRRLSHLLFLKEFHKEIRKPVLPRDETIDYLPTQVVAEYLANKYEPRLDGLIYSSSQTNGVGRNIVLFNHAIGIVKDKEVTASGNFLDEYEATLSEDDEEGEYTYIIEKKAEAPDKGDKAVHRTITMAMDAEDLFSSEKTKIEALRVTEGSLRLVKVIAVNCDTSTFNIIDMSNIKEAPEVMENVYRIFRRDVHDADNLF